MRALDPHIDPAIDPDCFALLDDAGASAACPTSRLYEGFEREHRCVDPVSLDAVWAQVEADQRAGLHAVLLIDYEWGAKLLRAGHERLDEGDASALRMLMFRELRHLSADEASDWLNARETANPASAAGVMNLVPSVDHAEFTRSIDRIQALIAAGETYQVNYTYRLYSASASRWPTARSSHCPPTALHPTPPRMCCRARPNCSCATPTGGSPRAR